MTVLAALLGAATGCTSEPARRMSELAGDYTYNDDLVDPGVGITRTRRMLTLRANATWIQSNRAWINQRLAKEWSDSGSYGIHRGQVVLRSSVEPDLVNFRVAGDTLWSDPTRAEAFEKAVAGQVVTKRERYYFLRVR